MTVLIIDDSELIRSRLIKLISTNVPGVQVYDAYDGNEALRIFDLYAVDRVILDLALPDISGVSVLREIKKKKPGVKVVVYSNYSSEEIRDCCLRTGADFFLEKNRNMEDILRALDLI